MAMRLMLSNRKSSLVSDAPDPERHSGHVFFRVGFSLAIANGIAQLLSLVNSFLIMRNTSHEVVGQYVLFLALMSGFSFAGTFTMVSSRDWANGELERHPEVLSRRQSTIDLIRIFAFLQCGLFLYVFVFSGFLTGSGLLGHLCTAFAGAATLVLESCAAVGIGILTGRGAVGQLARASMARSIVLIALSHPLASIGGVVGLSVALVASQFVYYIVIRIQTIDAIRCRATVPITVSSRLVGVWACFCTVSPLLFATAVQGAVASASLALLRDTLGGVALIAVLGTFERYRIALMYIPQAIATYSIPFLARSVGVMSADERQRWFRNGLIMSIAISCIVIVILVLIQPSILRVHNLSEGRWRMVFTAILLPTPALIANVLIGSRLLSEGAAVVRGLIDVLAHSSVYVITLLLVPLTPDVAYQCAQGVSFSLAVCAMLAYTKWRSKSVRERNL
jgi:hypothetical protein